MAKAEVMPQQLPSMDYTPLNYGESKFTYLFY